MLFKPHTLMFYAVTETPDAVTKVVPVPEVSGTGTAVRGQLTPMTSEAAFSMTGVELKRPHLFLCELADVVSVRVGWRATKGSRVFVVKTDPAEWDSGGPVAAADHAELVLEELQYAS